MRIFRWKFIIPTAIIIASICVFLMFYLDTRLKKVFISSGELIFGAKVEIESIETKLKGLSVNIRSIKIGDKDNEFKNLLDIDNIKFSIRFIPLLSKKIIIDDMTVEGIKWDTSRAESCKLPQKKHKKSEPKEESFMLKAMKELKTKAVQEYDDFPSVRKLGEIQNQIKSFSPQSIVDMAGILSIKTVQDSYVDLMGKYDFYNKIANEFDIKAQTGRITILIDSVSKTNIKTTADIQKLKDNLVKLNDERKNLEKTYNDLKAVKVELLKDTKERQNAFKNITSLINQDVDNIASKLSVPSLDFKNVTRILFGGIWVERADKVLYYMNLIRKYIPENKAPLDAGKSDLENNNKLEIKERLKGSDILYPVKNKLPTLFIANVKLSGTSAGEGKEGIPITFSGYIKDIAWNQKLIGRKTVFEVKGDNMQQTIIVTGSFDRISDTAQDIILFSMEGMPAQRLGIMESDYMPSFKDTKSKVAAEFILSETDFIMKAGIYIDGMRYDPSVKNFKGVNADLIKYVNMIWHGINSMDAQMQLSILKEGGSKVNFTSNIDKKLAQRFNNILNAAVGDVKVKIKQEVTQYVDSQKHVLESEVDKYGKDIQNELDSKLKEINKKINDIKKLVLNKEAELKKSALSSLLSANK
ncbi:MAG: TIGR03545 family protein [Endomicrobium sp.]|nr:TIGR03545 family protein [Endomicrobium sp.]